MKDIPVIPQKKYNQAIMKGNIAIVLIKTRPIYLQLQIFSTKDNV